MGHEQGRLRGVEGRHERVAAEDTGQSVNGAHGVLAGGGEVASNSTEGLRAGFASECAGNLLLHLYHANVPFDQVVIEGDVEIVHEGQGFLAVLVQAFEQVARFGFLRLPRFFLALAGRGDNGL